MASKLLITFLLVFSFSSFAEVDLVQVKKSERKLYLLGNGDILREYNISLGGNPIGHKEFEGDEKTPEGKYILDYKKEDSSFYKAMHISYPNKADINKAKSLGKDPGGFIMIHGQRNGFGWLWMITQNFDWTNGCIALSNSEMDEFMGLVKINTPIHILD